MNLSGGKKGTGLSLLLAMGLSFTQGKCAELAAVDVHPSQYAIMRPDRETRLRWIQIHNSLLKAPPALSVAENIAPRGSLSLLGNLTYKPSERDQGSCGNCWCWAGHGSLEILLSTQNGINCRLSVQYMNSCENAAIGMTCCSGGWLSDIANFYSTTPYTQVVPWSNPGATWQDGDASCNTSCGSITTTPNYPVKSISANSIITHGVGQLQAIANIKAILDQHKPVAFAFFLAKQSDWDTFNYFWMHQRETDTVNLDSACGHTWDVGGGGHEVVCVGYNDDDPNNTYWIMVNSWGTRAGRPKGIFRVDMNCNYDCSYYDGGSFPSYYWEYLDVTYAIPPSFSSVSASPSRAKLGAPVTISFTASETLHANPTVTVNAHTANYVTNSGANYTYVYTVQASDPDGNATTLIYGTDPAGTPGWTTNTAALFVDKTPPTFTSIAASPSLALPGTAVSLTFTTSEPMATNPAVTVDSHTANYVNKPNNTNYTYSYTIQASDIVGDATIIVCGTDSAGNAGSNTNTTALDVDTTTPVITLQPSGQVTNIGSAVTFQVWALGTPPLTYRWRKNGSTMSSGARISGTSTAVLSIQNLVLSDTGDYTVVVTNVVGVATSATASLIVLSPPFIVDQPTNQTRSLGSSVQFTPTIEGTAPLYYQWRYNGTNINDASCSSLTLTDLHYADQATYTVLITNSCGSVTSSPAFLAILPVVGWGSDQVAQTDTPPDLTNVVSIAAGRWHSLALKSDGIVVAWGSNDYGERNVPSSASNVVAIAAGDRDSLALRADGTLLAWGKNDFGQTNVPPGLSNVVAISAGQNHNLALKVDGAVFAWGDNTDGETNVPPGLSPVAAVAGGGYHSLALRTDGTVVAWGYNHEGQTNVPPDLAKVMAIAAGRDHSLALKADGTVISWGYNGYGQTNVPPNLSNVVSVAAGWNHSLALKVDGAIVAWGTNDSGQIDTPLWLTNAVGVAGGGFHSLVLADDATMQPRLWGPSVKGSRFTASAPTLNRKSYGLEYRNSLSETSWTSLPWLLGNGTVRTFSDVSAGGPMRYYRLRIQQPSPSARVDSISPPVAQPNQMVAFNGSATPAGCPVAGWRWTSDRDGLLGTQQSFSRSATNLTVGTHTITLQVTWSGTDWSAPAFGVLTVTNGQPTASLVVTTNQLFPIKVLRFTLGGWDSDENGRSITSGYFKVMSLPGMVPLVDGPMLPKTIDVPSAELPVTIPPGMYRATYQVLDDENSWSPVVQKDFGY